MSAELEGKVERLELQKDDLLVITFPFTLTHEQARRLTESLKPILERKGLGEGDVIVLDSGARLAVVSKAEEPSRIAEEGTAS
jgi:hypothetical protein